MLWIKNLFPQFSSENILKEQEQSSIVDVACCPQYHIYNESSTEWQYSNYMLGFLSLVATCTTTVLGVPSTYECILFTLQQIYLPRLSIFEFFCIILGNFAKFKKCLHFASPNSSGTVIKFINVNKSKSTSNDGRRQKSDEKLNKIQQRSSQQHRSQKLIRIGIKVLVSEVLYFDYHTNLNSSH